MGDKPTFYEVNDRLRYEPDTGLFFWTKNYRRATAGAEAGTVDSNGYKSIGFNKKKHLAHRVAWLLTHGEWPTLQLDHINGEKTDNRLCNLRECSRYENLQNRGPTKRNEHGLKGVFYNHRQKTGRKWRATIGAFGKQKIIGYFYTAEEAYAAYCSAAKNLHGEFARAA